MLKAQGFSLIEAMIVLAITGIVIVFSLPFVGNYSDKAVADIRITQLYNVLVYSRNYALAADTPVVVCPTSDNIHCAGSWSGDVMAFTDANNDLKADANEQILGVLEPDLGGTLKWKGFGATTYLKFLPYGFTNQQNGTFIYCSPSHQKPLARGIIINKSGRARPAKMTNQGGIVDANGQEIQCP